jgi:DNA invertase Pin-like site-specific DNA recombinase
VSLVGYARVSTTDQKADLQDDALHQAGCDRVFVDQASGASVERPQLAAALDYVRDGDVLVVWRLDRLGRSLKHLVQVVADLEQRGVGFKSLTESIDTTTPTGRLIFHIFASLAEFERDLIRERTVAGLTAARARGRMGGRRPSLTPKKAQVARQMYDAGDSTVSEIAKVLGVSRATIYRHLPAKRPATTA